ncbi:MAG: FecR domain-containing protein [Verrucomicrobiota bacterium]|jgi:cytochrome c-type biogenesis protein CcmH/NrfG/outer membrane receptor protein involved in Fe transport
MMRPFTDKLATAGFAALLVFGAGFAAPGQQPAAGSGAEVILLTFSGKVEVSPAGAPAWNPGQTNQVLPLGYRIRTGKSSRATLRLSNLSILRVFELTTLEIRPPKATGKVSALDLNSGAVYLFHRDQPGEIEFRTPAASGAIRGTEFNLTVREDGRTDLAMLEGQVDLSNEHGSVSLQTGEQAVVEPGAAPRKSPLLNAVNVIQWTLYYPGILDAGELNLTASEAESLRESLGAYRSGDLLEALREFPAPAPAGSADERVFHAGLLLSAGLAGECQKELESVAAGPGQAARLAGALREVIAAVKFQEFTPARAPELASEWLAQSYYEQSRARLPQALAAARRAVEKSPQFAFGWERVAELEFSFGRVSAAQDALRRSAALAPRNAQAAVLHGFLQAAENRIGPALVAFEQAIALDGALDEAWLGRGLCRIRRGENRAGLEDLEVAAALAPNRALPRSYLGKAFSQVHQDARAGHELELARRLDPNDPTSLLYLALLRQQENRVNEAIKGLEQAQDLNDNRAVYRSRLLLDQDAAVRGANLAGIYQDAGLEEVSVREAARAVNADYGNYSAHWFLANSYNQLRDPNQVNLRYETPWETEYLLANLLSPVAAGTLSQSVSQQEYGKLFEHDGLGVASSTEYLSRGAWTQSASQYGTFGDSGYSLDTFYRYDRGQRTNNDTSQWTVSAEAKEAVTARDTVFFQTIYYDAQGGDLTQYYNQKSADPTLRTEESQEPLLLLGYHHEWSPGVHTLLLAGRFEDDYHLTNATQPLLFFQTNAAGHIIGVPAGSLPTAGLSYQSSLSLYSAEAQQIFEQHSYGVILGARYQTGDIPTESTLGHTTPTKLASNNVVSAVTYSSSFPFSEDVRPGVERAAGYGYYYWRIFDPLQVIGGVTYDYLLMPENFRAPPVSKGDTSEDQVSPKAGVTWTPGRDTTVRFAYTRSLGGVSFDQSTRLEPSQVAGFTQAYRSLIPDSVAGATAGAKFETFGLALDQKFPTGTYLNIEGDLLNSKVNQMAGGLDMYFAGGFPPKPPVFYPIATPEQLDYREKDLLVAVHQLLGRDWAAGASYELSNAELGTAYPVVPANVSGAYRFRNGATLSQLSLYALFNYSCGFFARAEAQWNDQYNYGYSPALPGDEFWQINLLAGYRFFHRHAQVQVGVLNLTGHDYQLNPLNLYAELPRTRTFTTSFQFNF